MSFLRSFECYNITNNAWTKTAGTTERKYFHSLVAVSRKLFVGGGGGTRDGSSNNACYINLNKLNHHVNRNF